jgi:hypothetical protein
MQPYSDSSTSHNDTEQFRLTELVFSNLAPPQCSLRGPIGWWLGTKMDDIPIEQFQNHFVNLKSFRIFFK